MNSLALEYLKQLQANNNRDWFNANKDKYESARKIVEEFVQSLILELANFDKELAGLEAKKTMFRIYRDVMFSKNKLPYKTNMGSYISPGGKKSEKAAYYLHIEPGSSFIAGGAYRPESENLKKIRQEIYYNVEEYKKILNSKEINKYFDGIRGDKLKRPPKGFNSNFDDIELLKNKDFILVHDISDEIVLSDNFLKYAVKAFKALKPLNDFLNRAMD
ncbi:MAG: TIGR02453 family protein [Marinilabiliales bacterium]|nr:MAG: TIGR02453 family protein [Marinilabiliales bacterium]